MPYTIGEFVISREYAAVDSQLDSLTGLAKHAKDLMSSNHCKSKPTERQTQTLATINKFLMHIDNTDDQKAMFPILALSDRLSRLDTLLSTSLNQNMDSWHLLSLVRTGNWTPPPAASRKGDLEEDDNFKGTISKMEHCSKKLISDLNTLRDQYQAPDGTDDDWYRIAMPAVRAGSFGLPRFFYAVAQHIERVQSARRAQKNLSGPVSTGDGLSPGDRGLTAKGTSQHDSGATEEGDKVLQELQELKDSSTLLESLAQSMAWRCTDQDPKEFLEQYESFSAALEKFDPRLHGDHETSLTYVRHVERSKPVIQEWLKFVKQQHGNAQGYWEHVASTRKDPGSSSEP